MERRWVTAPISGLPDIGNINQRVHRFGELRRAIPGITQRMLTTQLRELESNALIRR